MPEGLSIIILFISIGFILLLIELFTPGFGLTGISGIVLLMIGSYKAYKLDLWWGIFSTLLSLSLIIGFFKIFTSSPMWKKIRLDNKETKDKGFSSSEDLSSLINKRGITISALRPSGIALIDGKRIDVTAESVFIDKNKNIKVIQVEGSKVVVKEVS